MTAGAASVWSTSTGALTVDAKTALNLGTANATSVSIGKNGVMTTVNGNTTLGLLSGDGVTINAGTMTVANDLAVTLSGGLNGINFDSQSLWPYLYQNYISPQLTITGTLPGAGQNLGTRRFDFTGTVGGTSPAAQTATLWNIGTSTLNLSCSANQPWLSASLSSAAIAPNTNTILTLSVNSAGLGVGTYAGSVTVSGGSYGTPETLSVSLNVRAPFVFTSISRSGDDINLAWSTTGGTTNVVQSSDALDGPGGFADLSGNIVIPGGGVVTNSYRHIGGATNASSRFYRVRMAP